MTPTPDHVPCRHCGEPISWDEICWVHDTTGFADCYLVIHGGRQLSVGVTVNPELTIPLPISARTHAIPVEEDWS